MKTFKVLSFSAFILLFVGTSCHTSKEAHAIKASLRELQKELKNELPEARVVRSKDSIKVIYPEVALFDFNKDEIKTSALPSVKKFAKVLKRENQVYFIVNGYTDNVGSKEVNNSLSQRRADNVKALLTNEGVDNARMKVKGMGYANPIMSNTTDEGRQANRRVEFVLYKECK